jgi:hypothetical protein
MDLARNISTALELTAITLRKYCDLKTDILVRLGA